MLVPSSIITTYFSLNIALNIPISYYSPALKFFPPLSTLNYSPSYSNLSLLNPNSSSLSIISFYFSSTTSIYEVIKRLSFTNLPFYGLDFLLINLGSIFSNNVPSNKETSWLMTNNSDQSTFRSIFYMS